MYKILILLCLTTSLVFANFVDKSEYTPSFAFLGVTYYLQATPEGPTDPLLGRKAYAEHPIGLVLPVAKGFDISVSSVHKDYSKNALSKLDYHSYLPIPFLPDHYGSVVFPIPFLTSTIQTKNPDSNIVKHLDSTDYNGASLGLSLGIEKVDAYPHDGEGRTYGEDPASIKGYAVKGIIAYKMFGSGVTNVDAALEYSLYTFGGLKSASAAYIKGTVPTPLKNLLYPLFSFGIYNVADQGYNYSETKIMVGVASQFSLWGSSMTYTMSGSMIQNNSYSTEATLSLHI